MKCVNAVDNENIFSTYDIEQGWRVAVILLFVDVVDSHADRIEIYFNSTTR
jgi:hypothetical protein